MPELRPYPPDVPPSGNPSLIGKPYLEAQSHLISNSHHFTSNHYPNDFYFHNSFVAEPNLHGLVETEVFVGGEEENFTSDEINLGNSAVPSSLVISYQNDGFLHSLNSVKEDIEAEAAEEEIFSGNYHSLDYLGLSLGHSSLSSSVISSASVDEPMNIARESHDFGSNFSKKSVSGRGVNQFDLKYTGILKTGKICKGNFSPTPSRNCTRGVRASPSSHSIGINTLISSLKEECTTCERNGCNGTPQKVLHSMIDKNKLYSDKKIPRGPIWHNPSKSDKLFCTDTNTKKDPNICTLSHFKCEGTIRAKSEAREIYSNSGTENKYSSLPRKKKEKSEKDIVAETYGTLGRNRKPKVNHDPLPIYRIQPNINISKELPTESKNILDKYATLPRRKAKEISARLQNQTAQKDVKDNRPSLQRSKSTGKGESARSCKVSPSNSACFTATQSPRIINNPTKQPIKLRIKPSNSPSAKLITRQSTVGKEKVDKSPSPSIYSYSKPKFSKIIKKNVEVQANIKWDPNENELVDKLRKLSEEHGLLQNRLARAENTADEVEQLRMEAVELRSTADSERLEKEELQEELDRTSEKVRDMLTSMEGVEKEFNNRGESLIELENQLQNSTEININMQEKLNQYEEHAMKLRKDLEKSLASQKILLQQVQDLEAEGREMVEFMAEEKNALSECLKEAELESSRNKNEIELLANKLLQKDEEARHMVRLAEERRLGYLSLQTEMKSMRLSTQDLMVCQGADISGASVGLANLASRLQILTGRLIQDYSISENDIENVVTPVDSDSSVSSTNGTPELQKSPLRTTHRSVSPRKPVSFMQSFLSAMRSAQSASKILTSSLKNTVSNVSEIAVATQNSIEGSASIPIISNAISQSLADQVSEIDSLITRFLKVCCVLKCDADNILSELEDENERLCSQIQLQQHMIDQQYADFESLTTFESNARKELKLITKDLEIAKETLNKVCDEDAKYQIQKVEEEFVSIGLTLHQLEKMHVEMQDIMTNTLHNMSNAVPSICESHRLSVSPYSTFEKHRHLSKHSIKCCPCRQSPSKANRCRREEEPSVDYCKNANFTSNFDTTCVDKLKVDDGDEKQQEIDLLVNHVLKTLEAVPDVVCSSPTLKNLYIQLNTSGPFEDNFFNSSHDKSLVNGTSFTANLSTTTISDTSPLNYRTDASTVSSFKTATQDLSPKNGITFHDPSHLSSHTDSVMCKSQRTIDSNVDRLSIIDRNVVEATISENKYRDSETAEEDRLTVKSSSVNDSNIVALPENILKLSLNSTVTENESNHLRINSEISDQTNIGENIFPSQSQTNFSNNLNNTFITNSQCEVCGDNDNPKDIVVTSDLNHDNYSTNTGSTCNVATNTEIFDVHCNEVKTGGIVISTNIAIDCNANPEITTVMSNSSEDSIASFPPDPCICIPLLTYETSL